MYFRVITAVLKAIMKAKEKQSKEYIPARERISGYGDCITEKMEQAALRLNRIAAILTREFILKIRQTATISRYAKIDTF